MYILAFLLSIALICFFYTTMIYKDLCKKQQRTIEKYRKAFVVIVKKGIRHNGIFEKNEDIEKEEQHIK